MMKYVIKNIFFLMLVMIYSCAKNSCSKDLGFGIDSHLFNEIRIEGKTYCTIVNKSLDGDENAILNLSKVKVGDGGSYQHGAVLIEVIDRISENKYLDIISELSYQQKKAIYYSYLWAGMDYTKNKNYKGKDIEKAFPIITRAIKNKNFSTSLVN